MTEKQRTRETEISEELRLLAQRLRETIHALRESHQAQELQQELKGGLQELRDEIEALLESEEIQRLSQTVRDAVEDVSKKDVGQQIRKGILVALKELNERLEQIIAEVEKGETDQPPQQPTE